MFRWVRVFALVLVVAFCFSFVVYPTKKAAAEDPALLVEWAIEHAREIVAFLVAAGATFASVEAARNAAVDYVLKSGFSLSELEDKFGLAHINSDEWWHEGIFILRGVTDTVLAKAKDYVRSVWSAITGSGSYSSSYLSYSSTTNNTSSMQSYSISPQVDVLGTQVTVFIPSSSIYVSICNANFATYYQVVQLKIYRLNQTVHFYLSSDGTIFKSLTPDIPITDNSVSFAITKLSLASYNSQVSLTVNGTSYNATIDYLSFSNTDALNNPLWRYKGFTLPPYASVSFPTSVGFTLEQSNVSVDAVTLDTPVDLAHLDNEYVGKAVAIPQTLDEVVGKTASDVLVDAGTPADYVDYTVSDATVDFSPLLLSFEGITTKFPFSIPWDISRILNIFDVTEQRPSFTLALPTGVGTQVKEYTISLGWLDSVVSVLRTLELITFDILLILFARKLANAGGD